MDASKKKTTTGRGQGGGTRRPHSDELAEGASVETNTVTNRVKLAPGFWLVVPRNVHLRKEGLQKAKKAMLSGLTKIRDSDNWSDSHSSNNKCYPGGGNVIELLIEHGKFLGGLPAYPSYMGGRSSMYHCPGSGTMKDWRKAINMEDWEQDERL